MNGRGVGSAEAYQAAEYIAAEFESYDLSAPPGGWIQEAPVTLAQLAEPPELALVDADGRTLTTFARLADYGESIERHGGSGQAEAPVTLLIFPQDEAANQRSQEEVWVSFKGLDLRGRIALILSNNALYGFDTEAMIRGAEGVLVVSNDVKPRNQVLSDSYLERPALPVFRITPDTADAILAGDGLDVETVRERIAQLDSSRSTWDAYDLQARVRMDLELAPPETVTLYNVVGLLNGADAALADDLVIVSSHYDGWGRTPDGTIYPGADGNATGVATMLEIARLWQEQEFQPRRSVLFAAWAGGDLPYSGAHYFRDKRASFLSHYNIAAVTHLDRLGGRAGEGLVVRKMGRRDNLFNLLLSSAEKLDVSVDQGLAMRRHYQQLFTGEYGDQLGGQFGTLIATWGDPDPSLAGDTVDTIDPTHLGKAAQVINLTLITAAHEPRY
jgi:hypothetical protein